MSTFDSSTIPRRDLTSSLFFIFSPPLSLTYPLARYQLDDITKRRWSPFLLSVVNAFLLLPRRLLYQTALKQTLFSTAIPDEGRPVYFEGEASVTAKR